MTTALLFLHIWELNASERSKDAFEKPSPACYSSQPQSPTSCSTNFFLETLQRNSKWLRMTNVWLHIQIHVSFFTPCSRTRSGDDIWTRSRDDRQECYIRHFLIYLCRMYFAWIDVRNEKMRLAGDMHDRLVITIYGKLWRVVRPRYRCNKAIRWY